MTTYPVSGALTVDLDLSVGDVHVIATDRADAEITITAQHPDRAASVRAAEQTVANHIGDRLRIHNTGKPWRLLPRLSTPESVDIIVEVPLGTDLRGSLSTGSVRVDGGLGSCELDVAHADVIIESTASLRLNSSTGAVSARTVTGDADVKAAYGSVRLGEVGGSTNLKNSYGNINIGIAKGPSVVRGAYGSITIDRALDSVTVKTAHGRAAINDVQRGTVTADSSYGEIEIGIHDGTAAWLDVESTNGKFRNELTPSTVPGSDDDTVSVRARTSYGDIIVTRTPARFNKEAS